MRWGKEGGRGGRREEGKTKFYLRVQIPHSSLFLFFFMTFFCIKTKKMEEKKQKLIFMTFFCLKTIFLEKKFFFLILIFSPKEKMIICNKNLLKLFFFTCRTN